MDPSSSNSITTEQVSERLQIYYLSLASPVSPGCSVALPPLSWIILARGLSEMSQSELSLSLLSVLRLRKEDENPGVFFSSTC